MNKIKYGIIVYFICCHAINWGYSQCNSEELYENIADSVFVEPIDGINDIVSFRNLNRALQIKLWFDECKSPNTTPFTRLWAYSDEELNETPGDSEFHHYFVKGGQTELAFLINTVKGHFLSEQKIVTVQKFNCLFLMVKSNFRNGSLIDKSFALLPKEGFDDLLNRIDKLEKKKIDWIQIFNSGQDKRRLGIFNNNYRSESFYIDLDENMNSEGYKQVMAFLEIRVDWTESFKCDQN